MPVGTSPRAARMLVEYWSGSAWVSLAATDGTSRILTITINDSLNTPRLAVVTLFNPRTSSSNIFETGDFDTVLKNKMKIRITDQATKSILFLGKVDDVAPENSLRGYTVTVTAYDSLIELQQNVLKKDFLNKDATKLKNAFISADVAELIGFGSYNQGTGNRSIEIVNTTDSDGTAAFRFQTSLGKKSTIEIDFGKSGGNYLNAIKRLGELEAGIESTASAAITGGLKPYNFYVDTNFQTTATNTEGSDNFFNYFPAGCMPAAAQSGTSYTVSNPADDGLTLMFGTGSSITETGQTLKMLPTFSFEDIARERITHLNARFVDPVSGYAKDLEFEVFNYKAISSGTAIQDLYEPSGTGTGGTETSKTISQEVAKVFDAASGTMNEIGTLQYISNTGGAGFALLSGTGKGGDGADAGSIKHSVAAGETLHIAADDDTTIVGTITLSDTVDSNGSDIFRPQELFKQKVVKNFSVDTGDILTVRRAVAAAFAHKDVRTVRGKFSMASGYPYHFVEGQVNAVSTNTITDSTIANQHATTTDGLAAANIDSFPTAGIRTGMVLHKLTGVGGTMAEYGYIERTQDNSLTADLTNSATFSTNDYYRTYIPLRAGHTVQIKNLAINSSPFDHVVTSIEYSEGEKGFMTNIETVGDISNPKALTAGERPTSSMPPIKYDDETYAEGVPLGIQRGTFSGTFAAGDTSGNNTDTAVSHSAGTFELDGEKYSIVAGDSEHATTGLNGAMADDTNVIISFKKDESETKFIFENQTDFQNKAATAGGGSGNAASLNQGNAVVVIGTAHKASHAAAEASFQLNHIELPGTNYKFDKDSISANSITADQIKANTITAGKIAANAITAAKLEANLVLATTIKTSATVNDGSGLDQNGFIINSTGITAFNAAGEQQIKINPTTGRLASGANEDKVIIYAGGLAVLEDTNDLTSDSVFSMGTSSKNRATGATLAEDLDTSEDTVDVSNGALFALGNVIIIDSEKMLVISISSNTLTVQREYESTSAATHSNGATITAKGLGTYYQTVFDGGSGGVPSTYWLSTTQQAASGTGFDTDFAHNIIIGPAEVDKTMFFFPLYDADLGNDGTILGHPNFSYWALYSGIVYASTTPAANFPAYSFNGDTDTGMYQSAANEVAFATGGALRGRFYNGGLVLDTLGTASGTDLIVDGSNIVHKKSSSRRYKRNVVDIVLDSNKVYDLRPVDFEWNEKSATEGKKDIGLIAEEVAEILPEIVNYNNDKTPESVSYDKLSVILLMEIKKLKEEIEKLKENK
tara:strand:+ start:973 stop:4788 length:3816 start_codon:yes stop_codon:yes gene_type:complete